ncbi:hypothetical protein PAGU1579_02840 [Veillonella tobetsuensis]|uniref:Uncharacterized protein n=1 Tax=Veillonella tobetsuensis TaxID=1110546 RepID=A0A480B9F4_9FIRM|nr:hypothetical protein PAGU1579_02840 [Veillonella tobetsuensis]
MLAAAVHKGTGSQSNNPTYDFKISDIIYLSRSVVRGNSPYFIIYITLLCDDK